MPKNSLIIAVLCLFFVIPLAFSEDIEEDESAEVTESPEAEKTRDPLIKTDGTIFGYPEQLDFSAGLDLGYDEVFWQGFGFRMDYTAGPFNLTAEIGFLNDQKYSSTVVLVPGGDIGGFYFLLREGGLSFDKGPIHLSAGRFRNYDIIDSPYSLFLNSKGISANTVKFKWESNHLIYQTQWIEINRNSAASSPAWNEYNRRFQNGNFLEPSGVNPSSTNGLYNYGFPDRGVNYKIYALKFMDMRLGFLDTIIYSGRSFDLYYTLIPLPMFLTQIFRTDKGRPWSTQMNDNSMFGFFWDIDKKDWDAYAQVLIDDVTMGYFNDIFGTNFIRNPWKGAWAFGGRKQTKIGRFGIHHGGAFKYTFSAIGVDEDGIYAWDSARTAYGYTYYPETRYFSGDKEVFLLIQDSMIGYKHGENNMAFQIDYQNTFNKFLITTELEFLLAGNNSPANPWHHYDSRRNMYNDGKKGTQIFNDGQIEKALEFRFNISRQFGNLGAYAAMAIGGRFNKLELKPAGADPSAINGQRTVDDEIWIWKATNKHELTYRISIGFRYLFPII